jgi:hypothetical protein
VPAPAKSASSSPPTVTRTSRGVSRATRRTGTRHSLVAGRRVRRPTVVTFISSIFPPGPTPARRGTVRSNEQGDDLAGAGSAGGCVRSRLVANE